jgi:hypothetical protein
MTATDRIVEHLSSFGPATDAQLSRALGLVHQSVNHACRRLVKENRLIRSTSHGGTIRNVLPPQTRPAQSRKLLDIEASLRPWFWEGNAQAAIVSHLVREGWRIQSCADTASKAPGKDIVACLGKRMLWVSVKGYPKGTERTNPATQARHWFSHAVFDILMYRTASATADLAIGLPDKGVTYRKLAERASWAFRSLPARVMWVSENGAIVEQTW